MLNERLIQAGKEARALEERCDVELAEQSRLLNESESELAHLRGEIEIARKAEDDLRVAIIEIDGRANAAIQNLNAEKSQLQAALDRADRRVSCPAAGYSASQTGPIGDCRR